VAILFWYIILIWYCICSIVTYIPPTFKTHCILCVCNITICCLYYNYTPHPLHLMCSITVWHLLCFYNLLFYMYYLYLFWYYIIHCILCFILWHCYLLWCDALPPMMLPSLYYCVWRHYSVWLWPNIVPLLLCHYSNLDQLLWTLNHYYCCVLLYYVTLFYYSFVFLYIITYIYYYLVCYSILLVLKEGG